MERLKAGETDAIDELYTRYSKKLYIFCRGIVRSRDPEDMVHNVFMRVIEKADSFNPERASFCTWLFRIARNHCIDSIRREERIITISTADSNSEDELNLIDTIKDESIDIEGAFIEKSVIRAVRECIGELENSEEKQAVLLYYIKDKVYREIGEIIGKSTSMARNLLNSAKEKVRRCLERKGFDSV
jgi:RNA polymerase sigma-70 factor (ECF subfamily)